ncbi:MAG: hypothetical protein K6F14_01930, partial [Clostridiales bacterium]|nr:hypothetical protein [Clostridiales bacterium]MCR5456816.1 hypothetical protein [Clostridiales bacterium]
NDKKLGQGKENAISYIGSDSALCEELEKLIKSKSDDLDLTVNQNFSIEEDELDEDDELLSEDESLDLRVIDISDDK